MSKEKKAAGGLRPEEEEFVPPAVRRQLEAAEEMVAQSSETAEPVAEDTPVAAEATTETPEPESRKDNEDWEHKYKVLKGKYDAEIPELSSRLVTLGSTLEQQASMIEDLQRRAQQPATAQAPTETPAPKVDVIDEAEFEGYGESIVKLVRQLNALARQKEPAATTSGGFTPEMEQRIQRMEQRVISNAETEYFTGLDQSVPEWRALNKDPRFLAWLQILDPITEIRRIDAIKRGAQNLNVRQVSAIFNAYKKEAGIVTKPAPIKKDINAQVQVVPSTTGTEGDGESEERDRAKYASKEDFAKAKDLYIKGRLSEADFNKVANRFQAAIRDKKVK